jgi:hypothetical protein
VKKALWIATALTTGAQPLSSGATQAPSSVLQSLPAEVQDDIERVRAGCREYLDAAGADASQSRISPNATGQSRVSSGDDGLDLFTVSGAQAVMVNNLELYVPRCYIFLRTHCGHHLGCGHNYRLNCAIRLGWSNVRTPSE